MNDVGIVQDWVRDWKMGCDEREIGGKKESC